MPNWLDKILPPAPKGTPQNRNLPVIQRLGTLMNPPPATEGQQKGNLPNATVIYAIASSILFVIAIYFLFNGLWFTGIVVLLPAGSFLGFALYFLKYWQ